MFKKFDIADHEKAFLFKQGRFSGVLGAGRHRFVDVFDDIRIETFDTNQRELQHPLSKQLSVDFAAQINAHLDVYQLNEHELGFLYRHGVLLEVLAPASFKLLWKNAEQLSLTRVDIREQMRLPAELFKHSKCNSPLIKQIDIADHEKAFLFKQGCFCEVLSAGRYYFADIQNELLIEKFDTNANELNHKLGKLLCTNFAEQVSEHLESYQLSDHEVGLLYRDDVLVDIVAPSSFKTYWKTTKKLCLQRVSIHDDYTLSSELLTLLGRSHDANLQRQAAQLVYYTEVEDHHVGLLYVNGKLQQTLPAGSYGYWKFHRNITVKHIDLRLQNIEVSGQEILTKDRVSLRLNLSASYRVEDPLLVQSQLSDFNDYLYRELQLQLREAVGTSTLDQLLNNKDCLNQSIAEGIRTRVAVFGLQVQSVGVRDIILPGEMKNILNQVVEAEKSAEANLIKRREETAATRSLYNTAKLMEGNPTLMRLKELEVLEKVTERIGNINVYSGLDGVLTDLIKSTGK